MKNKLIGIKTLWKESNIVERIVLILIGIVVATTIFNIGAMLGRLI